jgi:mono/diheme cytochrome c family protein
VQSDWLFDYLHDPGKTQMRPWLTVRMPTFDFSDAQANTVLSYFTARDHWATFTSAPPPADPRSLAAGEVVFSMLQCARCHPAGPVTAGSGGASTAELAPSLLLARARLRHDWVPEWIENPQGWVPGTRMPNFFSVSPSGEIVSQYGLVIDAPNNAANKAHLLRYFNSESELKAFLNDPSKVSAALRDHIWSLTAGGATSGGGR